MESLVAEYKRIACRHAEAERSFYARSVLGSSVIRVFQKGSKPVIMAALLRLDVLRLGKARSETAYRAMFEEQLEYLARAIRRSNRQNSRVKPGLKWGHATKVLCLYHRGLVMHSRCFARNTADRLTGYLFAPIDSIVIDRLISLGYDPEVSKIKSINSKRKFYKIQTDLGVAAQKVNVPRVWFDDNWGDRQ